MEILCNFWLVLEGKIGKEILEPSRLEFLKNFLANILTLLDAEDNTSGPLNRGGIADFNFVENTISNSAASRTLLQQLLACLNFNLNLKRFICWYKWKKKDFYKLWQQHKQLKTIEMSDVWPDTYGEECIR